MIENILAAIYTYVQSESTKERRQAEQSLKQALDEYIDFRIGLLRPKDGEDC